MKIVGEAAARGPAEAVWSALHDAAILARAIPGCEQFEVYGPGIGQFVATTALPAVGGTYAGRLTIVEQQKPSLLRLKASATGDQGAVTGDVTVRLSDAADATTLVSYEANGSVTGPLATVGTRLLTSAARRLVSEFFAAIGERVGEHEATPAADAVGTEPTAAEAVATAGSRGPADTHQTRALVRPGHLADNRAALLAGAAIGVAGVIIGVLAGRRGGRAGREAA